MKARSLKLALCGLVGLGIVSMALAAEPLATPKTSSIAYPQGVPDSPAQIELGRVLFFDTRLSHNGMQSCASCHNPELGFGDGMARGRGTKGDMLGRNTPHLYNLAWNEVFFWDGRAGSLEEQALGPIQSDKEMALPISLLLSRLNAVAGYKPYFQAAFGSEEITAERVGAAIAAFERTIIGQNSAFDRYLAGDKNAMSPEAQRGLALFEGKAKCTQCHDGANFTDNSFHNIGVKGGDAGRAAIIKDKSLQGAFKTPGLRNVALTAPYLHDGSEPTLESVVRFYNRGGDVVANRSKLIQKLNLSEQDIRDLVTFMGALTDPVRVERPTIPQN